MDILPEVKIPKKRGPKGPSKYTPAKIEKIAQKLLDYADLKRKEGKPIFIQGFCVEKRIPRSSLNLMIDSTSEHFKPELLEALERFKDYQEFDLAEGSLTSRYDSGFGFRALKNVSGWRDEQTIKGEGFNSIFNIVAHPSVKLKPGNRLASSV